MFLMNFYAVYFFSSLNSKILLYCSINERYNVQYLNKFMKSILLIGGAGYIGVEASKYFIKKNLKINIMII